MRKKVDNRVRILIENAIACRFRAFFVIVGDRGRDQVVNLHYLMTKILTQKPSVLWCYKKDLGFSSHRKKRMKQLKKKIKKGAFDPNVDDPFELFVSSTRIRYCYYKETQNILGQTFGMCILQDFEALTPNLLCRTIETVQGGGVVCLLLQTMTSLRQLYTMTMDIHRHLMSSALKQNPEHFCIEHRFNERFLLSLADCGNTLIVDDELNLLPISRRAKEIVPVSVKRNDAMKLHDTKQSEANPFTLNCDSGDQDLRNLKKELLGISPSGPLVALTATLDQAKVLMSLIDTISEKTLSTTISVTAGRGRGKSASLGLAISSAVVHGYSNIFVTAPSPENLGTLFEFIQKGLIALDYKEHADFELVEGEIENFFRKEKDVSVNTSGSKHLVRINVFRHHRQTIQYIHPTDVSLARQAEILVIDEAAAIPLFLLKKLMGPFLLIFSSTIHGYEGTGRALSLKLIQDLKNESQRKLTLRNLKELHLEEPIRYASKDPIEAWLNQLLCLYATKANPLTSTKELPIPSRCSLYEVNRQALFSYHEASESFLHNLVSLFVSSHYKNSPNDLLLLSDAPSHFIFVLLPDFPEDSDELPDIFVAIHVSIEGAINKEMVKKAMTRGENPSGDLIPWTLSQNYVDEDFGSLNGVRIVRIATHPSIQHLGYGTEALKQLCNYFEQKNSNVVNLMDVDQKIRKTLKSDSSNCSQEMNQPILDCPVVVDNLHPNESASPISHTTSDFHEQIGFNSEASLLNIEKLEPRDTPPLLTFCKKKHPTVQADYMGVCFGLTLPLFKFYNRLQFKPVYLRQTLNDITGEHSAIMLRCPDSWLFKFTEDFQRRTALTLSSVYSNLPITLSLSLLSPNYLVPSSKKTVKELPPLNHETIFQFFSRHDILRLERFTQLLVERSMILDLLPTLSFLVLTERFQGIELSHAQSAILLALGLQHKTMSSVAQELNISQTQAIALFNKALTKVYSIIHQLLEHEAISSMEPSSNGCLVLPNDLPSKDFESELQQESSLVEQQLQKKRKMLLSSLDENPFLKKYSIDRLDQMEFEKACMNSSQTPGHITLRVKKKQKEPFHNPGFSLKGKV